MTLKEVAKVLSEIVRANNQFSGLFWAMYAALNDDPLAGILEDWDECWNVAYNNNIDWREVLELVIYWHIEDKVRLGAYETK